MTIKTIVFYAIGLVLLVIGAVLMGYLIGAFRQGDRVGHRVAGPAIAVEVAGGEKGSNAQERRFGER